MLAGAERAHNAAQQRRALTWQASPRLVKSEERKKKKEKKKEAWQ
jgi:hypothetical protein